MKRVPFKQFIADQLIGKKVHFSGLCCVKIDAVGIIKKADIEGSEMIFYVDFNGKVIKIGSNHPNLFVESV